MANGAFKFKDNSGNVVSFISGSGSNISFSGGTLDLSGMTGLTLGNLTLSGTTQNAISTSHAASYLLTSSFNTYSGTTDTVIGTLQTSTGSLNSFTSSTNTRLNSIEGVSGSYATTGSNQFKSDQVITGSLTVTGFIDAQELRTTYISSSILYRSGSTKFGDELSDTHAFTGSMLISGSVTTTGNLNVNDGYVLISTDKGVRFDTSGASGNPELSINSSAAFNFLNTAGLNSLTIANSRNVGVGVTPSTWNSNSRALQLPQFVSLSNQNNGSLNLMSFALETSSDAFTYADTGVYPLRYNQNPNNGVHSWYVAGTGTAGNAITFTQAMTLDSSGRLGIGTNSPTYKLDVRISDSTLYTTSTISNCLQLVNTYPLNNTFVGITFATEPTSGNAGIASINSIVTSSGNADLAFSTRASSAMGERLRITSVGNIGIGVTSPTYILHAKAPSGSTTGLRLESSGGLSNFDLLSSEGDGNAYIYLRSNYNMIFGTNNTERMRLQSNGILKIGNGVNVDDGINPGYKNVSISFNESGNRGEIQAVQQQVLVYPLILNGAGGSVGIGTYSPATSTKLMVAGGIGFGNNTDGSANLSYGGRISAKQTSVTGGAGATLIHRGLGSVGYFILVSGLQSGNRFTDLIYGTGTGSPSVLGSMTENTAPTRTYTQSGENIFLSISGGAVFTVTTTGLGAMES